MQALRGRALPFALVPVFAAVGLLLYAGALDGSFVSDDLNHVPQNPHIQTLDGAHLLALLDPTGLPARATSNYAPVHLLIHALQWQAFGLSTRGYHVTNVLLHAGVCALLAALYLAWGVPLAAALLLVALFLVHPANVEAVAWVFQVKSLAALGLSIGALLLLPRRPLAAALLFGLALLTKISALYALPVAAARLWLERGRPRQWGWLAVWAALALAVSLAEFALFQGTGQAPSSFVVLDVETRMRSMGAIVGRYAAMAVTGYGVAPAHEPQPTTSYADPWLLLGAAVILAVAARALWSLVRRRDEAVYWVWVGAAYAPVAQLFPFIYPMADRYLYFVLPGLLGAAYCMLRDAAERLSALLRVPARTLAIGALAAGALLVVVFSARAADQSRLWRSEALLLRETARRYPDGIGGLYLRARTASENGDYGRAVELLDRLADRGYAVFFAVENDPGFDPMTRSPEFRRVVRRLAANWIRTTPLAKDPRPDELRGMGLAHWFAGDAPEAERYYQAAIAAAGEKAPALRAEWEELRLHPR